MLTELSLLREGTSWRTPNLVRVVFVKCSGPDCSPVWSRVREESDAGHNMAFKCDACNGSVPQEPRVQRAVAAVDHGREEGESHVDRHVVHEVIALHREFITDTGPRTGNLHIPLGDDIHESKNSEQRLCWSNRCMEATFIKQL